ncbi:MAG: PDZ domain-containing protein [Candidatus Kapabacteria bacterium]|nr:PDZ domain-containing protein [Candidatus Kapabacteria bacterium]
MRLSTLVWSAAAVAVLMQPAAAGPRTKRNANPACRTAAPVQATQLTSLTPLTPLTPLNAAANPRQGYLGVVLSSDQNGVSITEVVKESGAAKAGLRAGDVVTVMDGKTIATYDDLSRVVRSHKAGDVIAVTVKRDGGDVMVNATLGARPAQERGYSNREYLRDLAYLKDLARLVNVQPYNSGYSDYMDGALMNKTPCERLEVLRGTAFLGVNINEYEGKVHVVKPIDGTGASLAGIASNDVIISIDDVSVVTTESAIKTIRSHKPGDIVRVLLERGGKQMTIDARLSNIGEQRKGMLAALEAQCVKVITVTSGDVPKPPLPPTPPVYPADAAQSLAAAQQPIPPAIPTVLKDADKEKESEKSNLNSQIPITNTVLNVSPNPATNALRFGFPNTDARAFSVSLTDVSGRAVFEKSYPASEGEFNSTMDVSIYPRGTYYLSIKQGSAVYTQSVILE